MHAVRVARQALALAAVSAAVALAAAGAWGALQDGGFARKAGIALIVVAGLLGLTGGTLLSRGSSARARAFLGAGPEREDTSTGTDLTGLGVFLFVSLPLAAVGLVLLG